MNLVPHKFVLQSMSSVLLKILCSTPKLLDSLEDTQARNEGGDNNEKVSILKFHIKNII